VDGTMNKAHLHVVLRVLADMVAKWSDEEVLRRVKQLCPSTVKGIERWHKKRRRHFIERWRERLSSISWFMVHEGARFAAAACCLCPSLRSWRLYESHLL
jgi:hypothetical protein